MSEKVKFEQRDTLKEKPEGNLGFGQYFTDYMLSVDYDEEKGGWQELKLFLMHRLKFLQQHKVYTMVKLYLKV